MDIRCHGCITLRATSRPVIKAVAEKQPRVIVTNRTLLTRSAITPPHIDKTNIGPKPVKVNIPKKSAALVNSCISQRLPAISMNIPIFDVALPIQKILYSRNFKAANIGSTLDLKHLQKKARFVKGGAFDASQMVLLPIKDLF